MATGTGIPHATESPLVVVLGPTGSGKSDLALEIAQAFAGEVVNCDSLQIYRYFDIGTAKLSAAEMRGITHHLIDIADPHETFAAGDYARRARSVLAEITTRGRLPVVAGGTGFYVRALLDGLFEGPSRDTALRDRLAARERRRPGSLHRLLARFDRAAAARIHSHDVPKTMRALEVCLLTRRPITELFRQGRDALRGYRILRIGLDPDRQALYARLNARCAAMFEAGLADEVRRILDMGFPPESKPFESHGYKQALQLLRGEMTPGEALEEAQRNTRRYAKRQMTWFRREPGVQWFRGFGPDPSIRDAVLDAVRCFIQTA
ncbi:MAG TPA: tRNA (adenosine(37)-N6)-dimethylallyltransferase MiaA [Bryobacteraceae bacterium]|nr:tRNA (adenosine(37)-N6)-dimethylallyltransferase MiaA [Bryobacteraceae bacterium]